MLTQLRSQMKLIMWILVFAFLATIIFSWGMGGFSDKGTQAGILGKVDGIEISYDQFDQVVRRQKQNAEQNGETVDQEKSKQMREEAWNNQIETLLKSADAGKLDLSIADAEIAYIVENYPPSEVREADAFQKDGEFDMQAYQNFLRDPSASSFLIQMEYSVRSYLLEQKLNFHVQQAAGITEEEILDEYNKRKVTGKLQFISVPFNDVELDSSEITDEMLHRYYQLFSDKYKNYSQRSFAYVMFKLEASKQDKKDVLDEAGEILKELKGGADFAGLAKMYSQDASNAEFGGDLGWFDRKTMAKEFTKAVFESEVGEVVGPVKTKFGYHIIKVEGLGGDAKAETDTAKASHILLKIEPSSDTRDDVYGAAYSFSQDVLERDFTELATENGFKIDTTKLFSEAGYITGLGRMRMAAEFCFANPVGSVSGVYNVPNGYVVFQVVEATEETVKPFDEVETRLYKALEKILKKHKAWDMAADVRSKLETADLFEAVATSAGLALYTTEDSLMPTGKLPTGVKSDAAFLQEAFRLDVGEISEVISTKNGCYIAHMVSKSELDTEDYRARHPLIYQSMIRKREEAVNRNWVRELRIAGDIEDFQYQYFRDF